jgi:D-alanine-D-alanine ligase
MLTTERKLRVGIIFGGRSCEHEVSLTSAISVMAHLDTEKYEMVPIGISKSGQWLPGMPPKTLLAEEQGQESIGEKLSATPDRARQVTSLVNGSLLSMEEKLDVVFPILHGSNGEDGTVQGLLDLANVPYVGCGVLGSALGMDKEKMKLIFRATGLSTVDALTLHRHYWEHSPKIVLDNIEERLGYPCFVKPANGGSSIGVSKAYQREELERAIHLACEYDSKIMVEQAIECRELSCSVLGNYDPTASVVGEVIVNQDFYDYHAKYFDATSHTVIPADIPKSLADEIRCQAIQAFIALDLSGLARVDFFLEKETEHLFINEVNTLPSFTQQCMYPRLCRASGLTYSLLLDHLIELAIERHADRQRNRLSA